MAITKPTLDQLTGSIDAFVGSLDTDADLLRADFTKEPTLEELDSIVGSLDSADAFGDLDSLSFDFFSVAGSADTAITATATPTFPIEFDASVSVSMSATSDNFR